MPDLLSTLSKDSERVLHQAHQIAKTTPQKIITPDHLLLGLLQLSGSQAEIVLAKLQVNLANLKARMEAYIKLQAKQDQIEAGIGYVGGGKKLSPESTGIISAALAEAAEHQVSLIDTRLLIMGMLRHAHNSAAEILHQYGVTLERFREQARLHAEPVITTLPQPEPGRAGLRAVPIQLSPIFLLLLLVTAVSGYLTYTGIGNASRTLFFFVTGGWIISVALHEFGHALIAYWGGDESVVYKGYLTLDPLKYTHPLLSIAFPVLFLLMGGIGLPGGAVYINPMAIRSPLMRSLGSAAGPIASMLCALLLALPFLFNWHLATLDSHPEFWAGLALLVFLEITAVCLNLIPLPGLDGFGILEPFLPTWLLARVTVIRPFTFMILFALLSFDTPIQTQFWDSVWQTAMWINPDLGWLVAGGYGLFRFWEN